MCLVIVSREELTLEALEFALQRSSNSLASEEQL